MKKETLCAIPWLHLNFEPNGKVVPCCLTSYHNYFAGDLKTQSIDEIWNSDNMKNLRKQMMNGEEPKICSTCFNAERITGRSARVYHNRDYASTIEKIPEITTNDGACNRMELKYWDFRFSNLCNFKCRSCGPRYSSAWVPDAKKLGFSDQEKVWNIEAVGKKTNYDFLTDQIQHVERIYFAGGEPLMMPEHWKILDMLVENKKFDIRLSYNTNCSSLIYGKKNALDYWRQWDMHKIEIWPSLDEIGTRAELIRSGTVWDKVEDNLKQLIGLENIIVRPGITVGAWNVFRLPDILAHFDNLGVFSNKADQRYGNFFFNIIQETDYHVHILPDQFKNETIIKINNFINDFNQKYRTDISERFTHVLHELTKPHCPESAIKFLKKSKMVDAVRNENIFQTIPEMIMIRDMYPGYYD